MSIYIYRLYIERDYDMIFLYHRMFDFSREKCDVIYITADDACLGYIGKFMHIVFYPNTISICICKIRMKATRNK